MVSRLLTGIVCILLVNSSFGGLYSIHRENPKEEKLIETNNPPKKEEAKKEDEFPLRPADKPLKIFPSPNSSTVDNSSIHFIDRLRTIAKGNKTNDTTLTGDVIEKTIHKEKVLEDKKDTEKKVEHSISVAPTPEYVFPKQNASNATNPIHGQAAPVPSEKFPKNGTVKIPISKSNHEILNAHQTPDRHFPVGAINETLKANVTGAEHPSEKHVPLEVDDMNKHEKYEGECDVDDDKHVANKVNSKKCSTNSTKEIKKDVKTDSNTDSKNSTDPVHNNDAEIMPGFNPNGPHLVPKEDNKNKDNDIKITSANKVSDKLTAVQPSSSQQQTNDEPSSSSSSNIISRNGIAIAIISFATLAVFSYVGLLAWRKMYLRRQGREILINEDEFCEECTDSYQFEMGQNRNNGNVII